MRPRYSVSGIVLARAAHGEASVALSFLTPEFGLVRARAQGLRKPGAKLAPALQTLSEADAILVRGKDGWRISGALLSHAWPRSLSHEKRLRAGRIAGLVTRLMPGEFRDPGPFFIMRGFLEALRGSDTVREDAIETLAALRLIRILGLDAGEMPGDALAYDEQTLAAVERNRRAYIARVNHGITASGL